MSWRSDDDSHVISSVGQTYSSIFVFFIFTNMLELWLYITSWFVKKVKNRITITLYKGTKYNMYNRNTILLYNVQQNYIFIVHVFLAKKYKNFSLNKIEIICYTIESWFYCITENQKKKKRCMCKLVRCLTLAWLYEKAFMENQTKPI